MAIVYAHLPRVDVVAICAECGHIRSYRTNYRQEYWCERARQLAGLAVHPRGKRPAGMGRLNSAAPSCKYFEAKP